MTLKINSDLEKRVEFIFKEIPVITESSYRLVISISTYII